jgi:glycosyltransferase involved in cell wall biosynthesis
MKMEAPSKVLITGGREVGGLAAFANGLSEGFTILGIPSEVIPPNEIFRRWRDLRDQNVLKILSTTAVFAVPFAQRAICVAHGFPRADAQGWCRMAAILGSFKLANTRSEARLVAVSDYVAAHLRGLFNLRVDAVIRNPVQSCFLEPADESGERRYLTYVGRLLAAKNVHRLLPAMCDLQKENPELRICIIGDGPQRTELESSFPTDPPIEFAGDLDALKVRGYLRRTKVFVSGNEMEPFGITYLEALSQGCAVAMPACGGGLEIALDRIDERVYLLPLSFNREQVTTVLRRALSAPQNLVSMAAYQAKAVAEAYLKVDVGLPLYAGETKRVFGELQGRVTGAKS